MEHHVYFWLKDEHRNDNDRATFEKALKALFDIPGVKGGFAATPADTEERPVIDRSWDYALTMRFESTADHDAYQVHPDHDRFVDRFAPWWETVRIHDLAPL